jgi:hypothetical protein
MKLILPALAALLLAPIAGLHAATPVTAPQHRQLGSVA